MAYKVQWSDFAENELDKIFEYYLERAGINVAKRIVQKLY
jgi:plasmid stabilization system protein ParE